MTNMNNATCDGPKAFNTVHLIRHLVRMLKFEVTSTYMLVVLETKHLVLHVCIQTTVIIYYVCILTRIQRPISEKPILDMQY